MKQIIICAIAATAALSASADYSTLTFKTTGGDEHSIEVQGLAISFSDEELTAANPTTSISLPLSRVESMEFTDGASVDAIGADRMTEKTTVYDLNGRQAGTFASFSAAMAQLPGGVYLFRYADGTTLKIVKE